MSILCLGQAVFDTVLPLEDELVEDTKYRIYNATQCMGGPIGNASYLLALWGADTYTMARVGKDVYGDKIIETLKSVGVKVKSMLIDEKTNTSFSNILVNTKTGKRTILNVPLSEDNKLDIKWPSDIDIILMDGHEYPLCMEALDRYPKAISVLDGDKYKSHADALYNRVDYLVCSTQFAEEYTKEPINAKTYSKLCKLNSNEVILTLGEKGCLYKDKNYKAYLTNSIDTTGAGDVYHGAFTYGLYKGFDIEKIIRIASMAASISTERIGGMTSIPTLIEVKERLKEDI